REEGRSGRLAAQTEILLGRAYEHLGAGDLRLDVYRRAVAADPNLPSARAGLIASLAAAGRTDEAVTEWRGAVGPQPRLRTALARLLTAQNARLPRADQHWDEAERALDAAERASPGSDEVAVLRTSLQLRQDKPDAAREALESALAQRPRSVELWAAL